jgi:1,2-phenylacetyl-CoA epoxidase PaaB subunit
MGSLAERRVLRSVDVLQRRDHEVVGQLHAGRMVRAVTAGVLNRTEAKHDTWEVLAAFSRSTTAATDDDARGQVQEPTAGGSFTGAGGSGRSP